MPLFRYRAADADGKVFAGTVDKAGRRQVYEHLKAMGYSPIDIAEKRGIDLGIIFFNLKKQLMASVLPASGVAVIAGSLGFVLESGMPLSRGMELVIAQSRDRQTLRVLRETAAHLQMGESLWVALDKTSAFPRFFVHMAQVGEQSGRLPEVMEQMASYYEKQARITNELKSAMAYPAGVSLMMLGVIVIAVVFVVPNYAQMFRQSGAELPLITQALVAVSVFAGQNAYLLAAGLTALTALIGFGVKTSAGELGMHRLLLVSKTYVKLINLRFAQAMSLLSDAGTDAVTAVSVSANVAGNRVLQKQLERAADLVRQGTSLSGAMSGVRHFEPMLIGMVQLGEQTGRLPEVFAKCAAHLERETASELVRLSKLAEPLIMIMLGGILALIMLAILLPTFHLANIV